MSQSLTETAANAAINTATKARPCLMSAWSENAQPLRHWLKAKSHNEALAEDLLQEVFIRAMLKDAEFCDITNPRAWLYRVANNLLIDNSRKKRLDPLEQDIEQEPNSEAIIDTHTLAEPYLLCRKPLECGCLAPEALLIHGSSIG